MDKQNTVYRSENDCLIAKSDHKLILGNGKGVIPDGVKIIGKNAFIGTKIEKIIIPSSVETIEYGAFKGCAELKSIIFSEGLVKIESVAFYECGTLEQVIIPESVRKIGGLAFGECVAVFILPDSVETIDRNAFGGVDGQSLFASTNLPSSIIFTSAFSVKDGWVKEQILQGQPREASWCGYSQYICSCDFEKDEDNLYVKSFLLRKGTYNEATVSLNYGAFYAPVRSGYDFIGWATDENGDNIISHAYTITRKDGVDVVVALKSEEVRSIPDNTVLYAVWEKKI